jgi:hypothetical protein
MRKLATARPTRPANAADATTPASVGVATNGRIHPAEKAVMTPPLVSTTAHSAMAARRRCPVPTRTAMSPSNGSAMPNNAGASGVWPSTTLAMPCSSNRAA